MSKKVLSVNNWTIYLPEENSIKDSKRNIKNLKTVLILFIIKNTK